MPPPLPQKTWHRLKVLLLCQFVLSFYLALSLTTVRAIIYPQNKQLIANRTISESNTTEFNLMWQSDATVTHHGAVATGDFNGDGLLDIASNDNNTSKLIVYLNQGNRVFSLTQQVTSAPMVLNMEGVDIDGDGDLDIATRNGAVTKILIHINDGHGNFTHQYAGDIEVIGNHDRYPVFGDANGDGDLDILSTFDKQLKIYLNNGTGIFTENTPTQFASYSDIEGVTWGDINQDGRIDILFSSISNKVYLNQGNLLFSEIDGGDFVTESIPSNDLILRDIDLDGDLDLALGYSNNDLIVSNQIYENDGQGFFTNITAGDLANDANRRTYNLDLGDIDGDGDLDLATANFGNPYTFKAESSQIYRNDGGGVFTDITAGDLFDTYGHAENLTWGDMDNDGDLDLILVNNQADIKIYENRLGYPFSDPITLTTSSTASQTTYTTWGDIDNDNDLDIVISGEITPTIFNNLGVGTGAFITVSLEALPTQNYCGLALGDSDGDNDLDLILGGVVNHLYINQGQGVTATAIFSQTSADMTNTSATPTCQPMWGDADNDQDLDLLVVQDGSAVIYRNDGLNQFTHALTITNNGGLVTVAVWADVDGDNDLDLFIGGASENRLYVHDGSWGFTDITVGDLLLDNNDPQTAVWGDIDGDSDLDLFIGNQTDGPKLYRYEGNGFFTRIISGDLGTENNNIVTDADIGDIDGDGDLDLLLGLENQPAKLYSNDGTGIFYEVTGGTLANDSHTNPQVRLGDGDGDGDLDALISTPEYVKLYFNHQHIRMPLYEHTHHIGLNVHTPADIPATSGYGTANIVTDLTIPIPYTLWATTERDIAEIEAWYSPNGGGSWYPALAATGTPTQHIRAGIWPTGTDHVFYWDTFASQFSGQSNNVIVRLLAKHHTIQSSDSYSFTNQAHFPQSYNAGRATSAPFRVRTTYVQVFSETIAVGNHLPNAIVYQQTNGSSTGHPISNHNGEAYLTDQGGYLSGLNDIAVGDQLFALTQVAQTGALDFYHMSSSPTLTGLDGHTITQTGQQNLVISAQNPLIVANLDISLEWDAREDVVFLAQLERDLKHAGEILFDVTDGQLTLGDINVYYNKENWEESHIVVYTNNNLRPNVDLGGITTEPVSATLATGEVIPNGYLPGQVRMPREWNRFGNEGSTFGNDWALALAHELVHYILFIPDNYLGIDHEGRLIQIDCAGSVMTNAYLASYSELLTQAQWNNDPVCQSSVAANTTGRSDWETAQFFYPQLNLGGNNAGPYSLPLEITNVTFHEPDSTTNIIASPTYFIKNEVGQPLALPRNQVNVYRRITQGTADLTDDRLVRLGATRGDIIDATGIEAGDKLCLHDNSQDTPRRGCTTIDSVSSSLTLYEVENWGPEITTDLVTSNTIRITVTQEHITGDLYVQLYPIYPIENNIDITSPYTKLIPIAGQSGVYTAQLQATYPFFSGDIRIWENGTQNEEISNLFFGGGWGPDRFGWSPDRFGWSPDRFGWSPDRFGWSPDRYSWSSNRIGWNVGRDGWNAPLLSGDGNITLFDLNNMFGDTPPYSIQQLSSANHLPDWLTPIGSTYRVGASTPLTGSKSIMFSYLQRSIPSLARENELTIYYRPENSEIWQALDTTINIERNLASALMIDRGDYALIAVETYPVLQANMWNPFGYTIYNSRTIAEALASIDGSYRTVLWYDTSDQTWDIYDTTIEPPLASLVNTLQQFEYGQGYWIYATETITPYLGISTADSARAVTSHYPPMIVYGWVNSGTQTLDQQTTITALIDNQICGQAQIEEIGNRQAYTIQIDASNTKECNTIHATISLAINGVHVHQIDIWDNSQLHHIPLHEPNDTTTMHQQIFLPHLQK